MAGPKMVVAKTYRGDTYDWLVRGVTAGLLGLEYQMVTPENTSDAPVTVAFREGREVQIMFDWRHRPYLYAWGLGNRAKR